MECADLPLFLPDKRRTPAPPEMLQLLLPPPVLDRLLSLVLERIKPRSELTEEDLLALDPLPHHLKLREGLLALTVKLGNTRDLVDDLAPFAIAHLHDPGDITLHHDVVSLGLDPELRQELDDVALLAEAAV